MGCFIGLMSGTSIDGVDGVLASDASGRLQVLAHAHRRFEAALHDELLALNRPGENELHRAAMAANALTEVYADTVAALLVAAGGAAGAVTAIGAHGQTVRHRPGGTDGVGYTLQLINGALLAERTGIDVVCDLRSRDLAAGGQGAPLVPAMHAEWFSRPDVDVAVLNLGGIANLTLLPAQGPVMGFDCGPGNALLDLWCQRHLGRDFDDRGRWAAGGRVDEALWSVLRTEPYFDAAPPKSTGRDLFNAEWLGAKLDGSAATPVDVQATLAELTVRTVVEALQRHQAGVSRLVVCGGGARNAHLMKRLADLRPGVLVQDSMTDGLPPDQVEALAFAWLARACVARQPGNLLTVTGARGPRVLGAIYPAG